MWQVSWALSLIPDSFLIWIVNTMLLVGIVGTIAGFFIKFIPFVNTYRLPVQIISIIILTAGVWLKGGYSTEMMWRERVAEMEAKIQIAEQKSQETNTVIKKVYVDRLKVVNQEKIVIQDRIVEKEKIIDAECKVAPEAISILNDAAKTKRGKVTVSEPKEESK
jgi:hypothetical protein